MNENYVPQRGVDFDDFIGSIYLEDKLGLTLPKLTPVFCPANENHDDDFIGIRVGGYALNDAENRSVYKELLMYPTRQFTKEDVARLFDAVKTEDGTKYVPKSSVNFDEVYIRVCYSKTEGKADTIKWVSAVDGGEIFALSGERRVYVPKDAEA